MTKTLNQIIFFFLHQNQNIFFSNIGNQNIFLEKNHNPPFQVKWSFPKWGFWGLKLKNIDILILFNRQWQCQCCLLVKWTFDRRRRSNIGLRLNLLLFDLKCNIGWRYRGQRQSRKCLRKSNLNEIRLGLCKITIMHCWNTTWFSFLISFYPKCGSIAETLHFT
jgi:hypothetical protein